MKNVDVKSNTYIDFSKENNDEDPKFEVGDHLRISKCENIFAKRYTPNWPERFFAIKKVKNSVPWTMKIVGTFYKKELQKTNQKELKVEKVIKGKGDKLYVSWKGYDNSLIS